MTACGDDGGAEGGADEVGDSSGGIETGTTEDSESSSSDSTTAEESTGDLESGCEMTCGDDCCAADEVCNEQTLECVLDCGEQSGALIEPCGDDEPVCCGDGEICYVGMCITPGNACEDLACATETDSDCPAGEVCDPDLGQCVPDLADESCIYTPEAGVFEPVPRWSWGERQVRSCTTEADCQVEEICDMGTCAVTWPHFQPVEYPEYVQVMASPMVADLDGDCIPEVVFNSFSPAEWAADGVLRVLRGDTGEPVWTYGDAANRFDGTAIPAIGDLDYDGDLEIVNVGNDNRLRMLDHAGALVWTSDAITGNQVSGAPAIANFDIQGDAEIAYGRAVFDSAGSLLWEGAGGIGTNNAYATLSCVADLDGDLRPELIGGGTAYTFGGTVGVDFAGSVLWQSGGDGYCGVADFDLDGAPEVVVVRGGSIDVLDGLTGALLAGFPIPGGGMGGPPNIADFDGDGLPDIGLAGGANYVVVSFDGVDSLDTLVKLWDAETKDVSSNRTGSSVFDFDGDGRSEVVYGDEWYLRIYPGVEPDCQTMPPGPGCDQDMTDDEILFIDITSSGTRVEYPVIADVDGDFKAEIVVSTNNMFDQGNIGDAGVELFEDRLDNWVGTLPIWNQHSFHVTNVDAKGGIPVVEPSNWVTPMENPENSYRRNSQGGVENCAPDLVPQDLTTVGVCGADVTFEARVCNQGCLGVGPGVEVSFTEAEAGLLGTVQTDTAIPAGGCVKVELTIPAPGPGPYLVTVSVDDDGMGQGALNECIEDNNSEGPVELCPNIG
ncbi:FG-GAP repeat/HVR domain protein [Plesiocystis pacifica SIR-1]|uniref:FG-GAP repeat/HVR domain protein n=1 Tax=Plesiocystis pacifica SIR-1 TaxID=391625 RepID=A6GFT8_9BACT|nr:FG-GAP repeat/HVR domain protein [Plesiocystis pacifica SIR-1]